MSQWDRCSEVLSLWISNYKGTGDKKRVRRSLYNAVLQAGFPKVAVSLKVSLRLGMKYHFLPSMADEWLNTSVFTSIMIHFWQEYPTVLSDK